MYAPNLPGFTADASLFHTSGRYHGFAAGRHTTREQRVAAQRTAGEAVFEACADACDVRSAGCHMNCQWWPDYLRSYCTLSCTGTHSSCLQECQITLPPE